MENKTKSNINPFIGVNCIVRTYSAGVHIGVVESAHEKECHLSNSYRLWSWSNGGLSLSAIANNGVKSARVNYTGEIFLTEAIEFIPINGEAMDTIKKFIEDKKQHNSLHNKKCRFVN